MLLNNSFDTFFYKRYVEVNKKTKTNPEEKIFATKALRHKDYIL